MYDWDFSPERKFVERPKSKFKTSFGVKKWFEKEYKLSIHRSTSLSFVCSALVVLLEGNCAGSKIRRNSLDSDLALGLSSLRVGGDETRRSRWFSSSLSHHRNNHKFQMWPMRSYFFGSEPREEKFEKGIIEETQWEENKSEYLNIWKPMHIPLPTS